MDQQLRQILAPIEAHLAGRYNAWRGKHPEGMSLVKATRALQERMKPMESKRDMGYWTEGSSVWEHYRQYFRLTPEQAHERWK